jgi:hypothetical protein
MDIFSPASLPGVGLGDVASLVAVGGMVGVAVAVGVLLTAGFPGAAAFLVAAGALVAAHPDGSVGALGTTLPAVAVAAAVAGTLVIRSGRNRVGHAASGIGLLAGLVAAGLWWSDWEHAPFHVRSDEVAAMVGAAVVGLVGAFAAGRFIRGSVQAGGDGTIVQVASVVAAVVAAALALYVPFAGYVVLVAAGLFLLRQRRRAAAKHAGLRILNG